MSDLDGLKSELNHLSQDNLFNVYDITILFRIIAFSITAAWIIAMAYSLLAVSWI